MLSTFTVKKVLSVYQFIGSIAELDVVVVALRDRNGDFVDWV